MHTSERFQNKVVLITGGTAGIGLATAVAFANHGAKKIIVCGRQQAKWQEAQPYINKNLKSNCKDIIEYRRCDVRIENDVKELIAWIFDQFGRLDVCFNNAGVQPGVIAGPDSGFIGDMQIESMLAPDGSILYRIPAPQPQSTGDALKADRFPSQTTTVSPFAESEIATSCIGVFYCLKWQSHFIFERQPKDAPVSIITTSSRNGVLPDARRTLYAASKAFIIALSKSTANQLAQKCVRENRAMVRVNIISPGPVDTPLEFAAYGVSPSDKASYPQYVKNAATGVPMQRTAQPEEIAQSVLFLADDATSSYVTASNLCADGGHTGSPRL